MSNHRRRLVSSRFPDLTLALGAFVMAALPLCASTPNFSVPDDVALRIRLDDTLTSSDSEVGDPFSATVVDQGDYQGARVYGHIAEIDISGRIKGHTSMMLRFVGAGAGALLGGIFAGGKGAGIGSIIGGAGGLGTTAFHGRQKITLGSGQEMLIRITRR